MLAKAQQTRQSEGVAGEQVFSMRPGWSRRDLLVGAGAAGLLPLAACASRGSKDNPGGARVVIVGAGLAGMSCCHYLAKQGIYAEVVEALPTVGGRCTSGRSLFAGGGDLVAELGGQFIDSVHEAVLDLAGELGLGLLDTQDDIPLATTYFLLNQRFGEDALCKHLLPVLDAINAAWETIRDDGETISYQDDGGAGAWDQQSIQTFLEAAGADEVATALLRAAFISEYGLEMDEQSALNLILMLGTDPAQLDLYGGSDERYKIDGGNDQLVTELAARYQDRVSVNRTLSALMERRDGSFTLSFEDGMTLDADYVILSLPFTVLRQLDLSVTLSDVKRACIQTLGYGTNAKLLLPFDSRFWRDRGESGEFFTDQDVLQSGWDSAKPVGGDIGLLTVYLGGDRGVALSSGTVEERAAQAILALEAMYPGCSSLARSDPYRMPWPLLPTALGSYACYKVGQFTSIGGAEGEPAGNLRFCGEHTSYDWQGYMNGSVASGRREAHALALELWSRGSWSNPRPVRSARRFPRPNSVLLDAASWRAAP